MDSEQRPSAALINREWFTAAQSVLDTQDLGRVLVNACCYVFGLPAVMMDKPTEKAVFAMIRPALESDIVKYRERCARNAANAKSQWQRVAASGSDSQRVAANTTTTTTTTPTTTTTTTPSISPAEREIEEKFIVYGYFWSTGSKAVKEECNAFWSYYDSLGWKNNKGAAIVNKLSAARMWRRQYETGSTPNGAVEWFSVMRGSAVPDYVLWNAYAGAEINDGRAVVRMRASAKWIESFMQVCGQLLPVLARCWGVQEVTIDQAR